jgi:hypothetical protein
MRRGLIKLRDRWSFGGKARKGKWMWQWPLFRSRRFTSSRNFEGSKVSMVVREGRVLDWQGLHGNLAIGSGIIGSDNQSCLRCACNDIEIMLRVYLRRREGKEEK